MPTQSPTEKLLRACRLGQGDAAMRALRGGADPAAQLPWGTCLDVDGAGHTALMLATANGMARVAKALLAAGAGPNDAGIRGRTPLERSVGHPEALRLLLESGANPNQKNDFGRTALMEACELGPEPAKGSWCASRRTRILVHELAPSTTRQQALGSIRHLLAAGADPSAEDRHGRTPAFFCIVSGHIQALREVIDAGGNINAKAFAMASDKERSSLVDFACAFDKAEELSCLIELGADARSASEGGGSPMYEAARRNHSRCVEILLRAGVEANRNEIHEKLIRDMPFSERLIEVAMASLDAQIEARQLSLGVLQAPIKKPRRRI